MEEMQVSGLVETMERLSAAACALELAVERMSARQESFAAEAALPSLLGMAVDYKAGWDGHDARQKCGIITSANIEGQRLMVSGFLFARDYPEMEARVGGVAAGPDDAMGMSYELADAHVADMRASVWTLTRATFTGAAILLRAKAAYRGTSFRVRCAGSRGKALTQSAQR